MPREEVKAPEPFLSPVSKFAHIRVASPIQNTPRNPDKKQTVIEMSPVQSPKEHKRANKPKLPSIVSKPKPVTNKQNVPKKAKGKFNL